VRESVGVVAEIAIRPEDFLVREEDRVDDETALERVTNGDGGSADVVEILGSGHKIGRTVPCTCSEPNRSARHRRVLLEREWAQGGVADE
jgi:hypothetical protein